ncbi:hypothetical protein A8709_32680 [Paenibacillus pectinilyticus]|uniref:Uncharacterized protein n=1 Tax=Paenibacillus pectinilyticus TaxID=512399 RepID=A0A1C0ZWS8_9BACL|nr:hypothetical protein A8709_32680 [Paenibacillus pectinilyticus]
MIASAGCSDSSWHSLQLELHTPLRLLSKWQYHKILVISELYRQQGEMADQKKHAIADRIVSIEQPHVRPIVRGKAEAVWSLAGRSRLALLAAMHGSNLCNGIASTNETQFRNWYFRNRRHFLEITRTICPPLYNGGLFGIPFSDLYL